MVDMFAQSSATTGQALSRLRACQDAEERSDQIAMRQNGFRRIGHDAERKGKGRGAALFGGASLLTAELGFIRDSDILHQFFIHI